MNWLVCQQDASDKQLEQHAKEINLIANESLINDSWDEKNIQTYWSVNLAEIRVEIDMQFTWARFENDGFWNIKRVRNIFVHKKMRLRGLSFRDTLTFGTLTYERYNYLQIEETKGIIYLFYLARERPTRNN